VSDGRFCTLAFFVLAVQHTKCMLQNMFHCCLQNAADVIARLEELLADHNASSKRPMNLALFLYAAEHVARATRVLRQPGAHLLSVGVGGSGRASLARLAASIAGMDSLQIEVSKSYGMVEWREDLKRFIRMYVDFLSSYACVRCLCCCDGT
jgi:hypothetical protein